MPTRPTFAPTRLIDALVHAIHKTGGRAAWNLIEGNARDAIAELDRLAGKAG